MCAEWYFNYFVKMNNETQIERYKKLTSYIDKYFKEDIDIKKIEEICHYSYRNINRLFLALHNEMIGKYIKRIRLDNVKHQDLNISI